ncbi:MAG: peptidoglycan DD-metalloendopeptidase family protein [Bacteroidota bacterium]
MQKKIHLTDQLLNETENHQEKTLNDLTVLDRRIRLRKRLLYQLGADISKHGETIEELRGLICEMEEDIARFTEDYGKTAQLTYQKLESDNYWISVLSSKSFSNAYQQVIYFRQLRQFHQRKIRLLKESQAELDKQTYLLESEIEEKRSLIEQKKKEVKTLAQNKQQQEQVYASLKSKVSTFRSQLTNQQSQLKKLIRQSENIFLTSADRVDTEYGQNFPRNKGFLPWPISSSRGVIVGKFGKTEDPYGNQIENEGIYIRTPKGQLVRSVYSGKVSGVQQIPLSGYVVIIEHGEYRTVYANLKETFVKPGELVSANQQIGTVRTESRTNETVLNFLIYKMPDVFLNPEGWMIDP